MLNFMKGFGIYGTKGGCKVKENEIDASAPLKLIFHP